MKAIYVTHTSCALGVAALEILKRKGAETFVLPEGGVAGPAAVVLFESKAYHGGYRGNFLAMIPYRFESQGIKVPAWCGETPFKVALKPRDPSGIDDADFAKALCGLHWSYATWVPGARRMQAPWRPTQFIGNSSAFSAWKSLAEKAYGVLHP